MKCHCVVIDVLGVRTHRFEILAAVVSDVQADIHLVDPVELMWIGKNLLVVVRPCTARDVVVLLLPAFASIF